MAINWIPEPAKPVAWPTPLAKYRHYKGGQYVVLGVATNLMASDPCPLYFTQASHSEYEDINVNVGFWGNGKLFYYTEKDTEIECPPLVIYWSLPKELFWARPLSMWYEKVAENVPRFTLIPTL